MKETKIISFLLAIAIFFLPVMTPYATTSNEDIMHFDDMPDNWSKASLEKAVKYGILKGYNNKIRPNDNIKRSELAEVISRIVGLKEQKDLSEFTDVDSTKWYYTSLSKAVNSEILKGHDGKLRPNDNVTREEVFAVMFRLFYLDSMDSNIIDEFKDGSDVSKWAKAATNTLLKEGYVSGDNEGMLKPKKDMTRAEFSKLIVNMISTYVTTDISNSKIDGNVVLNKPNINLKNVEINGDLIVGEGLELSTLELDNVKVKGRILVRGSKGLSIKGKSDIQKIVIPTNKEDLSIKLDKDSKVEKVKTERVLKLNSKGKLNIIEFLDGSNNSDVALEEEVKAIIGNHLDNIMINNKKLKPSQTQIIKKYKGGEVNKPSIPEEPSVPKEPSTPEEPDTPKEPSNPEDEDNSIDILKYNPKLVVVSDQSDSEMNFYYYQVKLVSDLEGDYSYDIIYDEKTTGKKDINNLFPQDIYWVKESLRGKSGTLRIFKGKEEVAKIDLLFDFSNIKLSIKGIEKLEDIKILEGESLNLPSDIKVFYSDNSEDVLKVKWNVKDLNIGTNTIEGVLEGYEGVLEGYEEVYISIKVEVVEKGLENKKLEELKEKAKEKKKEDYTEESYKRLEEALKLPENTNEEKSKKVEALKKAIESLELVLEELVLDIKNEDVIINEDVANIIIEGKTNGNSATLKLKNISLEQDLDTVTLELVDGQFKRVIGMDNNPSGEYLVKIKAFKGEEKIYKEFNLNFENLFAINKLKKSEVIEDFEDILLGDREEGLIDSGLSDLDFKLFDELQYEEQDLVLKYVFENLVKVNTSKDLQVLFDEGLEQLSFQKEAPKIKEDLKEGIDFTIIDNYSGKDDRILFSNGVVFESGLKVKLVLEDGKEIKLNDSIQVSEGLFTIPESNLGDLDKGEYKFKFVVSNEVGEASKEITFILDKGDLVKSAKDLVEVAEKTKKREDYNRAKELVDTLVESDQKLELLRRLENLDTELKKSEGLESLLAQVKDSVIKAEGNKTRENLEEARKLVAQLDDENKDKETYIERLKKVEQYVGALENDEVVMIINNVYGHDKGAKARVSFKFKNLNTSIDKDDLEKYSMDVTSHKVESMTSLTDVMDIVIYGDFSTQFSERKKQVEETLKVNIYKKDSLTENDTKIKEALILIEELEAVYSEENLNSLIQILSTIKDSDAKQGLNNRLENIKENLPKDNEPFVFEVNRKFGNNARGSIKAKNHGSIEDKDLEILPTTHKLERIDLGYFTTVYVYKNKVDGEEINLNEEEKFHVHIIDKSNETEFDKSVRNIVAKLNELEADNTLENYNGVKELIEVLDNSEAKEGLTYRLELLKPETTGQGNEQAGDENAIEILTMDDFTEMANISRFTIEVDKVAKSTIEGILEFVGPVESMDTDIVKAIGYNDGIDIQGRVELKPISPGRTVVKVKVVDNFNNQKIVEIPVKITNGWPRLVNGRDNGLIEGVDYFVEYDYSGEEVKPISIAIAKDIFPREDLEVRLYKWDDKNNDGNCFPEREELLKDSPIILNGTTSRDNEGNIVLENTIIDTEDLELEKGYKYMLAAYDSEVPVEDKKLSNISPDFEIKFDTKSLDKQIQIINTLIDNYSKNPTEEYYEGIITKINILPDGEEKLELMKKAEALKNIEIPNTVTVTSGIFNDYTPGEIAYNQILMLNLQTEDSSDPTEYDYNISKFKIRVGNEEFYLGDSFEEVDTINYESYKKQRNKITIKPSLEIIEKLQGYGEQDNMTFVLEDGWCVSNTGASAKSIEVKIEIWR